MNDLDPCLAGCDAALAEAELLLAMLGRGSPAGIDLDGAKASIAALRREVDRLRGMKVVPARRRNDPLSIELPGPNSPWPSVDGQQAARITP